MGVPVPNTTPTLFPIANNLLTQEEACQVQHKETSGEIGYVLFQADEELYVTVGSDHTDRKLETFSVPMSKQACPSFAPSEAWRWTEVQDHFNQLELECWVYVQGEKLLYQKGTCADLLHPDQWTKAFQKYGIFSKMLARRLILRHKL